MWRKIGIAATVTVGTLIASGVKSRRLKKKNKELSRQNEELNQENQELNREKIEEIEKKAEEERKLKEMEDFDPNEIDIEADISSDLE